MNEQTKKLIQIWPTPKKTLCMFYPYTHLFEYVQINTLCAFCFVWLLIWFDLMWFGNAHINVYMSHLFWVYFILFHFYSNLSSPGLIKWASDRDEKRNRDRGRVRESEWDYAQLYFCCYHFYLLGFLFLLLLFASFFARSRSHTHTKILTRSTLSGTLISIRQWKILLSLLLLF